MIWEGGTMTTAGEPTRNDPADPSVLRVVLFGLPDAGKSSLLGALAQAAELQETQLRGRLFDVTAGLADLQQRVYQNRPRETTQEIVPYPVRYEPLKAKKPDSSRRLDLVLYDCDGRAANEILQQGEAFPGARSQKLVRNLLRADALVLVVDAAASKEQIERDFAEFEQFLTYFKRYRTDQTEVAALPVFLVLSKCDQLALDGDTYANWIERIQERCQEAARRLGDRLQQHQKGLGGFGTLMLDVVGTAVRRPQGFGPQGTREPYGVADLFSRVFTAAADYRNRRLRANRRLWFTLVGSSLLLGVLVVAALWLFWTRSQWQPIALAGIIESYRSRENPTPSSRLTEPLQRKISELIDIQKHPDFMRVTEEQRRYVEERLQELVAYQEFKSRLERERGPAEMASLEELARLEERLRESLRPPERYAEDWAQTEAELLRKKWLEDIQILRVAIASVLDRNSRLIETGTRLLRLQTATGQSLAWTEWRDATKAFLSEASQKSIRETEVLPNSRALPSLRAPALTYATVLGQIPVARSIAEWEAVRLRLQRLIDCTAALGLGIPENEGPPLLFDANFSFEQIGSRAETLRRLYPRLADWSLDEMTPSVRVEVQAIAKRSYNRLVESARQRIGREFFKLAPAGEETRDAWLAVARWIIDDLDFQHAQIVFRTLQKLAGEPSEDLPASLVTFLQRPLISLQMNTIWVNIPDEIHTTRLRPVGDVIVVLIPPGGEAQQIRFRRTDETLRNNRERRTEYQFLSEAKSPIVEFRPGAVFFVELDVRDEANQTWRLSWRQCRSTMYRYESLFGLPRFYKPETAHPLEGERKEVRLRCLPDGGVPALPLLLPDVNR
jgi:hypothetical protein